jgi:hypothetical protein
MSTVSTVIDLPLVDRTGQQFAGLHAVEKHECEVDGYTPDECPPCLRESCGHGDCRHTEIVGSLDPYGRSRWACDVAGCDCDRMLTEPECVTCDGAGVLETDQGRELTCPRCGGSGAGA